jgi:hypothetical protein
MFSRDYSGSSGAEARQMGRALVAPNNYRSAGSTLSTIIQVLSTLQFITRFQMNLDRKG